jgi:hypothetical protein
MPASGDCWTRVHELLEIETRLLPGLEPESGLRAHFFAIATYQLQHPFRVAADALAALRSAVAEMLADDARPIAQLRRDIGRTAGRGKVGRQAEPGDRGHVDPRWPRTWSMTAADVVAVPDVEYPKAVVMWARKTVADLDEVLGPARA